MSLSDQVGYDFGVLDDMHDHCLRDVSLAQVGKAFTMHISSRTHCSLSFLPHPFHLHVLRTQPLHLQLAGRAFPVVLVICLNIAVRFPLTVCKTCPSYYNYTYTYNHKQDEDPRLAPLVRLARPHLVYPRRAGSSGTRIFPFA